MDTPSPSLSASDYKFITVFDSDFRGCIKDMADTITRLGLWQWFRDYDPSSNSGYMFSSHENITKINNGLTDNPHSGATFAYCMRIMQAIARDGFTIWNQGPKKECDNSLPG